MLAFVHLIAALLLFLLSTKQWRLWIRGLIWLCGAIFLGAAISDAVGGDGHFGLFRMVGNAVAHSADFENSVLWQSFARNRFLASRFLPPLIDIFLAVGTLLAVFSVLAFTPGERLERIIRPLKIALIGAVCGGLLMAAIVGAGFGGPINPRAYAAHFEDATEDVHDGDTFWVGETSVRLWGVDAPELNQTCRNRDDVRMCGEISRDHLISLLSRSLVQCVVATKMSGRADEDGDQKTVRETFGRPIVRCEVTKDPTNGSQVEPFDLAERMIRDGYAVMYRDRLAPMDGGNIDDLRNAELLAKRRRSGLLTLCWVEPGDWRDAGRTFRRAFEQDGLPADFRGSVIGQAELCPSSDNRH